MKISFSNRGAELFAPSDFDLKNTFECGQCFRWSEAEDGSYSAVVMGKYVRLYRDGDTVIIENANEESFNGIWKNYFDVDTDYEILRQEMIELCPQLAPAAEKLNGIRILYQEPWEALCSFIISQNNNIPRIQGIVSRLCQEFGNSTENGFSFPAPERLADLEPEDLSPLRAGFRARYIIDAARKVSSGEVDLETLKTAPIEHSRRELMKITGVGAKVAECTLLYGLHRMEAFPIDVWMKKALSSDFDGVSPEKLGRTAGIAQQYIFHYTRQGLSN